MSALKILPVTALVGYIMTYTTGKGWGDAEFWLMIMGALLMMGLGAWMEAGYQEKQKRS